MSQQEAWERRLHLLRILLQRGTISTRRAAAAVGCDRRKALGDLQALREHGVPLDQEGEGADTHWRLDQAWRLAGRKVALEDRLALLFGRDLVQGFLRGTSLGEALDGLDRQVAALGPVHGLTDAELRRRFFYVQEPEKDYGPHRETVEALVRAILGTYRVSFTYATAAGRRKPYTGVAPLTLGLYKRGAYLFFEEGGSLRRYALERISGLEPMPALRFDYPRSSEYDPARALAGVFGITTDVEPAGPVVLRFRPEVRRLVESRRWMPGQVVTPLPDGGCDLCFTGTGPELVPLVLSFGRQVRVIEPAWLRARVVAELEEALAAYRD